MNTLFGMKVLTSPHIKPVPVLQVSPTFEWCSDSFRADMNKWLLDKFGEKGVAYVIGGDALVLNHDTLMRVKKLVADKYPSAPRYDAFQMFQPFKF